MVATLALSTRQSRGRVSLRVTAMVGLAEHGGKLGSDGTQLSIPHICKEVKVCSVHVLHDHEWGFGVRVGEYSRIKGQLESKSTARESTAENPTSAADSCPKPGLKSAIVSLSEDLIDAPGFK